MLKIKTESNKQIDIENKSIEVSDKVSADGAVTIAAKTPTEITIIKAEAVKAIVTEDDEISISSEDAKSVRKIVGILRAPFAESVKQNGNNSADTETSNEFTYEPTPGKISKLFVHVSEDISEYDPYTDLERMFDNDVDPKPTLQEICEGKAALPLPLYALYKANGDVDAAEDYLMAMLTKSPADYDTDENSEGSMFVIVDGDGIERPDLIGEMKNAYLSKSVTGEKNFLDQVFDAFIHPENEYINASDLIYGWPLKLVEENLIKSVVLDVNFTMENTCNDIVNTIRAEKDKLGLSDDEVSESNNYAFNGSGYNTGCRAYVLSSDLLFNSDNWETNEFKRNDNRTFAEFWAEESSDNYSSELESRPSASDNWKGVYVIQKAIEEGRALDVYVKKAKTSN